jgi:hypothetical protein
VTTLERDRLDLFDATPPALTKPTPPAPEESKERHPRVDPASVITLGVVLVATGVVHAVGYGRAPGLIDDEGTYVAQSWSVLTHGALSHYTYWYDHPPLGWIQVAGWMGLAGGFRAATLAVIQARTLMLVAYLVGAALLYLLARRLGFSRLAAGAAVALYGFSPLALSEQRMVLLDNLAVPWLLGALVLATSQARRLWAFAGSGACLAVAVLTKETFLLLCPAVVWLVWSRADARTRRFCVTAFSAAFVLILACYPLFAALKGELVPTAHRVSLIDALQFQLVSRPTSGSVFDVTSAAHRTLVGWLSLDSWLVLTGTLLIPVALCNRRLRPLGIGLGVLALVVLRGGYLPGPYVIGALPFAALITAGAGDLFWRGPHPPRADRHAPPRPVAAGRIAVLVALVIGGAVVAPRWARADATLMTADHVAPLTRSAAWLDGHVPRSSALITDDTLWVDLVNHGFDRNRVVWFQKLDFTQNIDPSVTRRFPQGWRGFDYVVSTPALRDSLISYPQGMRDVRAALNQSHVVASFGSGSDQVQIRAVTKPSSQGKP